MAVAPDLAGYAIRPWQNLYFFPDPHGQAALRPTVPHVDGFAGSIASLANRGDVPSMIPSSDHDGSSTLTSPAGS